MKKIALTALSMVIISSSAFAQVPSEITNLLGRLGTFTSLVNGKRVASDSGTDCKVEMNRYGGEDSIEIDSVAYFTPVAHLLGAKRSVSKGVLTLETTEDGKRPGGSVCGDYTPLTSYKKTVIVTNKSLTIKQKYSCAFFDRTELVETCTVK